MWVNTPFKADFRCFNLEWPLHHPSEIFLIFTFFYWFFTDINAGWRIALLELETVKTRVIVEYGNRSLLGVAIIRISVVISFRTFFGCILPSDGFASPQNHSNTSHIMTASQSVWGVIFGIQSVDRNRTGQDGSCYWPHWLETPNLKFSLSGGPARSRSLFLVGSSVENSYLSPR